MSCLIRPWAPGLLALLLVLSLSISSDIAVAGRVQDVDRIVAVVDDDVIVQSELDREVSQLVRGIRQKQPNVQLPPKQALDRQVLERLILKRLQLAAAERAGISIGDDLLAQVIGNIARKNGMTLSQFRGAVERDGMRFRSFREQIRTKITISQLHDREIRNRISVTQREIDAHISRNSGRSPQAAQREAFHLYHILVALPEGASSDEVKKAKRKAQQLVTTLRQGADFKQTAMAESDGHTALEGGDLGWRRGGELPTLFADVAPGMEKGEVSNPIRSSSGFHIIKLADFKGGNPKQQRVITQSHTRHILIKTTEITSDSDARFRLGQLKQRIESGDDFGNLARSHSDDQGSAIKGGDLGWVSPGDMVPEFEQEMDKLSLNQVSEPFQTSFGWHIAQILERRQHDRSEEMQKIEAQKAIRERKASEEIELYLRRLRDEAFVDIRLDDIAL
jgi:peptidyl-prolyl cis-trans isomerase SurA